MSARARTTVLRATVVAGLLGAQLAVGAGSAAAAQPSGPCTGCGPSVHVVQKGEWLWKIARADLAARGIDSSRLSFVSSRAKAIHARNRAVIGSNPHRIRPGMRLVLPPL